MAEITKFWMLVAAMCGVFAIAEYMYACEAIRVCRDRSRDTHPFDGYVSSSTTVMADHLRGVCDLLAGGIPLPPHVQMVMLRHKGSIRK